MKRIIQKLKQKDCRNIGVITYKLNWFEKILRFFGLMKMPQDNGYITKYNPKRRISYFTSQPFDLDGVKKYKFVK
jgi:hypothetical protein